MSNKRNKRSKTPQFHCPHCQKRLWRLGSLKYHLFYRGRTEIKKHLGLTPKKASFLASQNSSYVDRNCWLEDFFCEEDGKMWLRLTKKDDGSIASCIATRNDWNQTLHTINPDSPNPSVSEFSYRMSRGCNKVFN